MWDEAVDRAIDDVAREMTAGEPHGDLRARVMTRIDGGDARLRGDARLEPSRYTLGALGAAAIVLLALVTYRETRPAPQDEMAVHVGADLRTDVRLKPDTTNGPVAQSVKAGVDTRSRPRPAAPRRVAIPSSPIDALAPPPLDVAPIAVGNLVTDPIDVAPIDTIAPLAVAPLGQGDRP